MQTFTAKIYSIFLFVLASQLALAQFRDDFSDNDFILSPPWSGSDSLFAVTDYRLMLNGGDEDGVAFLATPSNLANPASWEFSFSFQFNPSAANYARVYLLADQPILTEALNGYFVMLGGNKDQVSLYKQSGVTYTEIISSVDGLLNSTSVDASVRVSRDEAGWKLFIDIAGNGNYTLEGIADDNAHTKSNYFGILCTYTATRSDKFFFDDFNISESIGMDGSPPALSEIEVISPHELRLTFSEPLNEQSAVNLNNYAVDGNLPTVAILAEDHTTVLLSIEDTLEEKKHSLTISGIMDLNGNAIAVLQRDFVYVASVAARFKDIVISEIFPDPSPPIGLAESEFVEIFNRSDNTFDLTGWTISDGTSTAKMPISILLPKTYLVLTSEVSDQNDFNGALFLNAFPSLNNGNDALMLKDEDGTLIDSVNYSQSWYRDPNKENGGWTLEIIDPDNICGEHENWSASEHASGGTPGFSNSILASRPDLKGPVLISAFAINSMTILLNFDEKLEKSLPPDIGLTIDPPLGIVSARFSNQALTQIEIATSHEIQKGKNYSINIRSLKDCAGNLMQEGSVSFGLPESADSLDILITEILFNPRATGVDFVEIMNNSVKFISLKGWSICNPDKSEASAIDTDLVLAPGEYLAITSDPGILKGEYLLSPEEKFFQLKNLPSYDDDAGTAALVNAEGNIIDALQYSKNMHSVFIKDDEGVSLERIANPGSAASQNWKSASGSVGFATPGYTNSNAINPLPSANPVMVEPEIFNPLAGQANFTLIHYSFDKGGYLANVKIFDSQGRSVKELSNNDILGTSGFYRWDGDRDDGSKAGLGYYMVWFEIFDAQGTVKRYQKRIAVASSFR